MSLFLRFASVKCPGRIISGVKRFYWTNHSFTLREGLGIRYFIPRTANNLPEIQTEQKKDRDPIPENCKVIYNFGFKNILDLVSCFTLFFAGCLVYVLYNHDYLEELAERRREEANKRASEEPDLVDKYTIRGIIEVFKTVKYLIFHDLIEHPELQRLFAISGLAMMSTFFFFRSRIVLEIYRHNNYYKTVFYQVWGTGRKEINHQASDCIYNPDKMCFNHKLMGKDFIIFPNFFVSSEEEELYNGKKRW